jgi:hypothetical protein
MIVPSLISEQDVKAGVGDKLSTFGGGPAQLEAGRPRQANKKQNPHRVRISEGVKEFLVVFILIARLEKLPLRPL